MAESTPKAVIVGAGVLGLTSALELRARGYEVTFVARDLPHDYHSQGFASPWAIKMYPAGQPKSTDEAPYLYEFESMGLNVPRYLQWLVKRLSEPHKDLPGPPVRFLRGYVPSLKAAAELVPGASLVINASGLGAKNLEDVRDDKMYPIRGQTVLVYAPRFRDPKVARCYSRITKDGATYVIPRARSGQVILGGTFDVRKTDTLKPNADVTDRILRNCVELAPELLPETADPNDPTAYVTVDVLRNNIGVRPAREGGVRVELDKPLQVDGHEVGVIHAYGIGPAGYQASYGVAAEVGALVDEWRSTHGPRAKL
ncbi:hypothetical protein CBS14141_000873 [Malassezia furfur]|nr:hypothetical protein CBS14141_000873 [Malassezia furfur]